MMCGRYFIDVDEKDMQEIIEILRTYYANDSFNVNEIFPYQNAPILVGVHDLVKPTVMRWGFDGFDNRKIINARSETMKEKKLFSSSYSNKRCVVPTNGFYEWKTIEGSKKKEKYYFKLKNSPMLYLAGIYQGFDLDNQFVIITTQANASMEEYHHRMPLILERNQVRDWLFNDKKADSILQQVPVNLTATDC